MCARYASPGLPVYKSDTLDHKKLENEELCILFAVEIIMTVYFMLPNRTIYMCIRYTY